MPLFPLPLESLLGHWNSYLVYILIGFAFGYVLEIAGFGSSPKLAAQFYFKDLTVLKVMFGAIITAMVLVFLTSAVGLLDYNLVYVNPTYLWPGILGGLAMGVGFILGGFCPGTSLVSAAVLRIDGMIFVLGVFFGIFLFGETVGFYEEFWHSSYLGRFTLPELFGLPTGIVVVAVVLMALFMFWGSEQLERLVGKRDLKKEPKWRYGTAAILVGGAVVVAFLGQPTTAEKWARLEATEGPRLANREVQIDPAELLSTLGDPTLQVIMLDVRSEAEYNLFHLRDAQRAPLETLPPLIPELREQPANTVFVVMSNDETAATEAWKLLRAESVPSVYILEGGLNGWIDTFADQTFKEGHTVTDADAARLGYTFDAALGSGFPFAAPDPALASKLEYTPKIKLELKRGPGGGGCG
jgi:rhodanese-related sulfurtransferase